MSQLELNDFDIVTVGTGLSESVVAAYVRCFLISCTVSHMRIALQPELAKVFSILMKILSMAVVILAWTMINS